MWSARTSRSDVGGVVDMRSYSLEPASWQPWLRIFRASRPRLARKGARAQTFTAGLNQAEQLWRASALVEPVASPILLFYGLAQCGRSICAAGIVSSNGWRGQERHGLDFDLERPPADDIVDLNKIRVRPSTSGLVQQVAGVLNSPVLNDAVSLSELIATLDTRHYFDVKERQHPRPLSVQQYNEGVNRAKGTVRVIVGPVPDAWVARREHVPASSTNLAYTRVLPPSTDEIREWLAPYPKLAALGAPQPGIGLEAEHLRSQTYQNYNLHAEWLLPEGAAARGFLDTCDRVHVANVSTVEGSAVPNIGGNSKAMHELIVWWLILYAFSMLARYYPSEWSSALDFDRSELAVPIDHLILTAQDSLATLCFDVLGDVSSR